ncbi:MAG: hypothetical protein ACMXX7_01860 [Candidatus Woesearchaeota archaeon]
MKKVLFLFLVIFLVGCSAAVENGEIDDVTIPEDNETEEVPPPPSDESFRATKDFDGTIHYEGIVMKPNPCYEVMIEEFVDMDSLIVDIMMFDSFEDDVVCSQVITPYEVEGFNEDDLDTLEIYVNGDLVLFEVFI